MIFSSQKYIQTRNLLKPITTNKNSTPIQINKKYQLPANMFKNQNQKKKIDWQSLILRINLIASSLFNSGKQSNIESTN